VVALILILQTREKNPALSLSTGLSPGLSGFLFKPAFAMNRMSRKLKEQLRAA